MPVVPEYFRVFHRESSLREAWKNIIKRGDVKDILERAIESNKPTQTLLLGPAGSAKSLLMTEAADKIKGWYYFDASNLSGKGLFEFLDMHQNAKVICLDEIDKLNKKEQACLYNFLEEKRQVIYNTGKLQLNFTIPNCKVIATSNSLSKLTKPFRSRFLPLAIKGYTEEEFTEIAVKLYQDEKIPSEVASEVARIVWQELDSHDVRMLKHIRNLIKDKDTIETIGKFVKQIIDMHTSSAAQTEFN